MPGALNAPAGADHTPVRVRSAPPFCGAPRLWAAVASGHPGTLPEQARALLLSEEQRCVSDLQALLTVCRLVIPV